MSRRVYRAVDDWALALPENQVAEYLGQLELRVEGNTFHRLVRLTNWMLGNYSETDFENSTEPAETVTRRKGLREALIHSYLTNDGSDDALLEATEDIIHPLQQAQEDPEVQTNLNRTTDVNNETTETQVPSADERTEEEQNAADSGNAIQTLPSEWMWLTSTDGKEFTVPRELSVLLVQLIERVNSLHNQVHEVTRASASSTRLEPRRQSTSNVRFQETFTIAEEDQYSSPLEPNRRSARPQGHPSPAPGNQVWAGGRE